MNLTAKQQNASIKFRRLMGRTYLHENRLEEAVECFVGILRELPDDIESLITLGNLYLASGDGHTAGNLYRRVLEQEPENTALQDQLAAAAQEENQTLPAEPVPTDVEAVSRLLQRLTGKPAPISEKELMRAAKMLQDILLSSSPAREVAAHLDEIEEILPALIEINIRQARADGFPLIAEGLQKLQINIGLQKSGKEQTAKERISCVESVHEYAVPECAIHARVLQLEPNLSAPSSRSIIHSLALTQAGFEVTQAESYHPYHSERPDVIIASNPHANPALAQNLAICAASGIPIIIDLDTDFEGLPITHPGYRSSGLGKLEVSKAYTASLMLANLITVPSEVMAHSLHQAGFTTAVVLDGWNRVDPTWQKPAPTHNPLSIGWIGATGSLEDFSLIRRTIIRVLREFENTRLTIVGNALAYQTLDSVPNGSKVFLPYPSGEDYLPLLDQIDILLVPLRDHPFHYSKSDRILMEAGLKGIPWVASPIPSFEDWGAGGLIVNSREEWHTYIRQLILDPDLRRSMGQKGFLTAGNREAKNVGRSWSSLIGALLKLLENRAASQVVVPDVEKVA